MPLNDSVLCGWLYSLWTSISIKKFKHEQNIIKKTMRAEYKHFMKKSRYTHIYQDINRACVPENLDHFYLFVTFCIVWTSCTVNIIVFIIGGKKLKPSPFKEKESSLQSCPSLPHPSLHTHPAPDALIPVRALPFFGMFQRFNGLTNKNASQDGLVCWVQEESQFSSKIYSLFLWNSDVKDLKIRLSLAWRDESSVCAECRFLTLWPREQSLVQGSHFLWTSHLRARPEQGRKLGQLLQLVCSLSPTGYLRVF